MQISDKSQFAVISLLLLLFPILKQLQVLIGNCLWFEIFIEQIIRNCNNLTHFEWHEWRQRKKFHWKVWLKTNFHCLGKINKYSIELLKESNTYLQTGWVVTRETTSLRENQEVCRFKSRSYQGESFSSVVMIAFIYFPLKLYFSLVFNPSLYFLFDWFNCLTL